MADRLPDDVEPFFRRVGPDRLVSPLILSVPHAGRSYGEALLADARLPESQLMLLEDRLVDRLIWRAVANGATALIAETPRALIDLNRDEQDMDPLAVAPPHPETPFQPSPRARSGLGLVPTRLSGIGAIWRGRLRGAEVQRRITAVHRPYHAALAALLAEAKRQFGIAILLDCHSMPPRYGSGRAGLVLGDRHGTSADSAFRDAALGVLNASGHKVALNQPYAGGHITAMHGRPENGVHAVQIEIDRSLYLDAALVEAGEGFDAVSHLIAAVAEALVETALGAHLLAAE
ncbi:N-formylglutamate amidohydrolase [Allosphingosinicella vermicomposti]|uniref:N-formylglutamate amidohydrolase n=1 Tax=Allosphingosinicella vermicomposti TaxID=614671 RepID=UPI000D10346E|nr:N-formylglutamate amidohydrolase [Allosphingosinicella vermicomposti]